MTEVIHMVSKRDIPTHNTTHTSNPMKNYRNATLWPWNHRIACMSDNTTGSNNACAKDSAAQARLPRGRIRITSGLLHKIMIQGQKCSRRGSSKTSKVATWCMSTTLGLLTMAGSDRSQRVSNVMYPKPRRVNVRCRL